LQLTPANRGDSRWYTCDNIGEMTPAPSQSVSSGDPANWTAGGSGARRADQPKTAIPHH